MATNTVIQATKRVHELLAAGRYGEAESLCSGVRLAAQDMETAISEYGRTLTSPPPEAYGLLDAIQIRGAVPPRWSVTMPFWTKEEGRSDLSLELTVTEAPDGPIVEIDDIHVL